MLMKRDLKERMNESTSTTPTSNLRIRFLRVQHYDDDHHNRSTTTTTTTKYGSIINQLTSMASVRGAIVKKGDLEISLLETKGIKDGDIFCILDLPPNKPFKTHLFKGPDPKFNQKFILDLMTLNDEEIIIVLKEQKLGGSKFLGQIQIPIKALSIAPEAQWYYLTDRPSKAGKTPKVVSGSVLIHLNFIHRYQKNKPQPSGVGPSGQQQKASPWTNGTLQANPPTPQASSSSSAQILQTSTPSSVCSSQSSSFSSFESIEYSQEEAVIIEETLKDKENIVMKQLKQQKDIIKQYNETIGRRSSTNPQDKIKMQKLQEEIDEMEKLVSKSTPAIKPIPASEINTLSSQSAMERSASSSTLSRRSTPLNRTLKDTSHESISSTRSVNASKIDISKFSFDKQQQQQQQSNTPMSGTIKSSSSLSDLEIRVKVMSLELENERQSKEQVVEKNKMLLKENERLEREVEREKLMASATSSKKIDDLTLKVKIHEAEIQSLIQEKQILVEKAKIFEKDADRLEKDLDYERQLKRKEGDRKESERGEVKRMTMELELANSKIRLLQSDLEKKSYSSSMNGASFGGDAEPQVQMLQVELESEKKLKELATTRVKTLEKDGDKAEKTIQRLEAEVARTNKQLERVTTERDQLEKKERESVARTVEEKLNEAIKLLIQLSSSRPDGASVILPPSYDITVARKIKDIQEKVIQQQLKNREMELGLMEMRSQRINRLVQKQQDMSDEDYLNDSIDDEEDEDCLTGGEARLRVGGARGRAQLQQQQISILVSKLDKLDKLEELMRKLDNMKTMVPAGGDTTGAPSSGKRSYTDIKNELTALQKTIFNDKAPEKEREEANIKFEKVYQELVATEEHKRELLQIQEEKRRINEPLNQKALQKLLPIYQLSNIEKNVELKERVRLNPELTLIGMDPKAILSKHQNDFLHFFLANLTLDELRAIRVSLPKWRADQKKQVEWTTTLEERIDQYAKNPPAPKPAPSSTKPKVNIKKPPPPPPVAKKGAIAQVDPQSNIMNELLKRRKRVE
ncbi:C2 domain-containing protein [Cavenderia fasciculata]|uniref:C2 domain-containing protein n=1 Tax=Cavenderia fasciculata TaxID=261658 RepID=F4Q431_CACFS|nr:C2 domain-containing protein [Cavenderia fasciculata]EGG16945.1 C2 domain-containing protein [Cavenderia fasciculata]|eukprot:XP_004355419.1 C2 domain-containing protein [Cavenderia fasciculata]